MITETSGNLLRDPAQALVNTVNTVGVMGKGIALQFKRAYPEVFAAYAQACAEGRVRPGHVFPVQIADSQRWVLNFPTKRHWRQPSRLDDIRDGLDDLARLLVNLDISSVAVPPLGCGNGGLSWSVVRPLIIEKLGGLDIDIRLYGPGTPDARDMITRTAPPTMTTQLRYLIAGLARYISAAFDAGVTHTARLSVLEAHKVSYLLQSSGIDLNLRFVPHLYGPFSPELNRILADLEGHYLVGYGDGTGGARADLEVSEEAMRELALATADDAVFNRAWATVQRAIVGFEYPEGMELLATVHYLATRPGARADVDALTDDMADWNERKRFLFRRSDVSVALDRLHDAELVATD
ncbi:type II toxin-antitoxin system antitoxin DNA ADP-ribosyl glycohydrolase DarG [Nonomuraea wenchangensis]|uniref:type II toxin-antitoxin system antitoxin DNA ADP-ribosyl glycohydrolase DarG n=1 Tax=Nonomuraea wenchangensis TaxID=568860 RepID=UPI003424B278